MAEVSKIEKGIEIINWVVNWNFQIHEGVQKKKEWNVCPRLLYIRNRGVIFLIMSTITRDVF